MWQCSSPRMSPDRRRGRAARPRAPPRARRGSRAAPAGSYVHAEQLVDLLLGRARVRGPGGVVERPRTRSRAGRGLTASVRSASLCCFEPVRCWSRLPKFSGGTMRRSIAMPLWVTARAPASPDECASPISGSVQNASASAAGVGRGGDEVEVLAGLGHPARAAGDLHPLGGRVLAQRVAERLGDRAAPCERSSRGLRARPSAPAVERRRARSPRPWRRSPATSAELLRPRRPAAASSSEAMPELVEQLRARFLGPSPGMRVTSTRPGGNLALSLSADGISPVSSSASIFSAIVLPMPGELGARPCAGQLLDRRRPSRGSPWPRCGRRAPGARSRRRARRGRPARRRRRRSRRSALPI